MDRAASNPSPEIAWVPFELASLRGVVASAPERNGRAGGAVAANLAHALKATLAARAMEPLWVRTLAGGAEPGAAQVAVSLEAPQPVGPLGEGGKRMEIAGVQALGVGASAQGAGAELIHLLVRPSASCRSGEDTYRSLFEQAGDLLARRGLGWPDVVRTWFYLPGIAEDYAPFNAVRSQAYGRAGLGPLGSPHPFPASTGVGGVVLPERSAGAELLIARGVTRRFLGNEAQAEASQYGSAFVRGVQLGQGPGALVFVSGTAAIGARGESLHRGEPEAQLQSALDNVGRVLRVAGCTLGDCVSATLYAASGPALQRCGPLLNQQLPVASVPVLAALCRPELLVEIEAVAVAGRAAGESPQEPE